MQKKDLHLNLLDLQEFLFVLTVMILVSIGLWIQRSWQEKILLQEEQSFAGMLSHNFNLLLERDRTLFEMLTVSPYKKIPECTFKNIYEVNAEGRYLNIEYSELGFRGYIGGLVPTKLKELLSQSIISKNKPVFFGPSKQGDEVWFALAQKTSRGFLIAELDWLSYLKLAEDIPKKFYFFPIGENGQFLVKYSFLHLTGLDVGQRQVKVGGRQFSVFSFGSPKVKLRFVILTPKPFLFGGVWFLPLFFIFMLAIVLLFSFWRRAWEEKKFKYPLFLMRQELMKFSEETAPDFSLVQSSEFISFRDLLQESFSSLMMKLGMINRDHEILSSFFEYISMPLAVVDQHLEVLRENLKFRELFVEKENADKIFLSDLLESEQLNTFQSLMHKAQKSAQMDLRFKLEGGYRDYRINVIRIENQDVFLSIWEDKTELNRLKARILRSQRERMQFSVVRGIAHDLRHELTYSLGYIEMMLLKSNLQEREGVEEVKNTLLRAKDLARMLTDPQKLVQSLFVDVDLEELLREVLDLVEQSLFLRFTIRLETPLPKKLVRVDKAIVRQVLEEIFFKMNEILMKSGTFILKIRVEESTQAHDEKQNTSYAIVRMILMEKLGKETFHRFYLSEEQLGMTEANKMLSQFDATIFLKHKKQNEIEVDLHLPLSQQSVEYALVKSENAKIDKKTESSLKDFRVLIVDDEDIIRTVTKEFLIREGCNVETAEDGWKAKEKLAEFHPDLILSDVRMPGYDGFYLLNYLEEHQMTIPVLLMSAYFEVLEEHPIQYPYFKGILDKPFSYDQLISEVEKILLESRQTKE